MAFKHVLIYGVSRSGKTTLASKLNKKLGLNVVCLDDLVGGFVDGLPELKIEYSSKRSVESEQNFNKTFTPFLNAFIKKIETSKLNYCLEGVFFDFDVLSKAIDFKNFVVVALGYPKLSQQEIFEFMKKYDTTSDWTFYLSDKEKFEKAGYYREINKEILKTCNKLGFKFFDVSLKREKVLEEAFDYVKQSMNL